MVNYISISDKINELVKDQQEFINAGLIQIVLDFLKDCPDDSWLEYAAPIWNKRSNTLEIRWKFECNNYRANVLWGKQKLQWSVVYNDKKFNHLKHDIKEFYTYLQQCIGNYNDWYKVVQERVDSKLQSKIELRHELVDCLKNYIHQLITNNKGEYDGVSLGIHQITFRPYIGTHQNLEECNIYNLNDYIDFDFINLSINWYEHEKNLKFDAIDSLVKSYFPADNIDEIKYLANKRQTKKKITKNEFYRLFNQLILQHLEKLMNQMIYSFNGKNTAKRYLGVDIETLNPYIAIKEGLVGCDVYDLNVFLDCYEKDKKGKFLFKPSKSEYYGIPIVKDETLIKRLVNFYFDKNETNTTEGLPLLVKAEDNVIPESEYEYVYKGELDKILGSSDILGKFGNYKWNDRYVKLPKTLMGIFREQADDEEKRHKEIEQANIYSQKAVELKKERNYADAIQWYLKCKELMPNVNVGTARGMFQDLLICYRMVKDKANRAVIAKEAHRAFPDELEFEKAFLETSGQLIQNSLPPTVEGPANAIDYGILYEKEIRQLPEYTFSLKDSPFHKYNKSKRSYEWYISDRKYYKMIEGTTKIQNHFWGIIRKAQAAEALGKIDEAVVLYEHLLAEGYYSTTPFDRLIIIYNKNYRTEDLKRVLTKCIQHFKDLEKRQLDYVTSLAKKYNAMKELKKMMEGKGEVWYWGGNILLYKKYKKVEEWEKRLSKLM